MNPDEEHEIDFTGGARGRFHRPGAALIAPIHLEPDVLTFLQARAEKRGMTLGALVNLLLRKEIEVD
jgi:hypothetical protein